MVLNLNNLSTADSSDFPQTSEFLENFHELLGNLKTVFMGLDFSTCDINTVIYHVIKMKNFVFRFGGQRAGAILAQYEKYSSIGDKYSCRELEPKVLEELESFRECWLSMLS